MNELQLSTLGQQVREARREQGLSRAELERKSGIRQTVIWRLETGRTDPQINTVLRILRALGKTLTLAAAVS